MWSRSNLRRARRFDLDRASQASICNSVYCGRSRLEGNRSRSILYVVRCFRYWKFIATNKRWMKRNWLLVVVLVVCRFGSVICTSIMETFRWKLRKLKLTKCAVLLQVCIVLQLIQIKLISTLFVSSSGNARWCFVMLICFRKCVFLYIYKNHCIWNTSNIFVSAATFKPSNSFHT